MGAIMETPDVTLEDGAGAAAALAALGFAINSGDSTVQLAAVIMTGLVGLSIVVAGAYRRGKRAEFVKPPVVESFE